MFTAHLLDSEAQQNSDKGRRRTMPGYIGYIEQRLMTRYGLVIHCIATQVKRRQYPVIEIETSNNLRRLRQHVYLHMASCLLVLFEYFNALFHFGIDKFQLFADAAVFFNQPRAFQAV